MKRIYLLLICFLSFSLYISADEICDDFLLEGKQHYNSGNYKKAKECFVYVKNECGVNYGDVTVNKISQAFESMKVQLNYSDIILNLTEDMSFTYDIKLLYGDIENDLLEKYAKRIVETKVNTKTMTGNINDSDGKHKIIINGNYSDVE